MAFFFHVGLLAELHLSKSGFDVDSWRPLELVAHVLAAADSSGILVRGAEPLILQRFNARRRISEQKDAVFGTFGFKRFFVFIGQMFCGAGKG